MISDAEKELAIKHSRNYFEGPAGRLLFEILADFTAKTIGLKNTQISPEKLMECIVNIAASEE